MSLFFHVVTSFPTLTEGGMEISTRRILLHLLDYAKGSRAQLYARHSGPAEETNDSRMVFADVHGPISRALAPLPVAVSAQRTAKAELVEVLVLQNEVARAVKAYPQHRHIILSFYVSANGLPAQRIADTLSLPHIAAFRGTDFNADAFSSSLHSATRQVVDRSDYLVLTNHAQRRALDRSMGRREAAQVIYNSVDTTLTTWAASSSRVFFSDCGFSFKKGTELLLEAFERLQIRYPAYSLKLVGPMDTNTAYWKSVIARYSSHPAFDLRPGLVPADTIASELNEAAAYVSASLGEGCSRAVLGAAASGVPIVATRVGALADGRLPIQNYFAAPPADVDGLVAALEAFCDRFDDGSITVDMGKLEALRKQVSPAREAEQWRHVLDHLNPKPKALHRVKPRIMLFVHDGAGLGHLRRICNLARKLQGQASCLIVSGHKSISWMAPTECEFVHLPSLDSLIPKKAAYWGRVPFVDMGKDEALRFRRTLIDAAYSAFEPDALITDYLPCGKFGELKTLIFSSSLRKYCLFRGVLGDPAVIADEIFDDAGLDALDRYDRLLVTADRKTADIASDHTLPDHIAAKLDYVGYVTEPVDAAALIAARAERGVASGQRWVVCSGGSGYLGERLASAVASLASEYTDVLFDIVHGPRSSIRWPVQSDNYVDGNVRYWRESRDMKVLHAAADIVVTAGGYNSMVEALQGSADILCVPSQLDWGDEQWIHATRLAAHAPVTLVGPIDALPEALRNAFAKRAGDSARQHPDLDFGGAQRAANIILADLAFGERTQTAMFGLNA